MKQVLLFITLLTLGLLVSCHKSDPEEQCPDGLPCATQEGANTFGCYIDGKPWVANIAPEVLDPTVHKTKAWYDESNYNEMHDNFLHLQVSNINYMQYEWMNIHIKPVLSPGAISLKDISDFSFECYLKEKEGIKGGKYDLDTLSSFAFNIIKLDEDNNIISGIFSLRAINYEKYDTISISDGRFDLKYYPE